jgi:hypothetical protein
MLSAFVPSIQERLGMTQSKNDAREQARRVAANRHITKSERESKRRRLVIMTTAVAVAIALVAVVSGVVYDKVIIPAQTVATVGSVYLSRADVCPRKALVAERQIWRKIYFWHHLVGSLQNASNNKTLILNHKLPARRIAKCPMVKLLRNGFKNESLCQAAKADYQLVESEGQADQALVADYGMVFGNTATPLVATATSPR